MRQKLGLDLGYSSKTGVIHSRTTVNSLFRRFCGKKSIYESCAEWNCGFAEKIKKPFRIARKAKSLKTPKNGPLSAGVGLGPEIAAVELGKIFGGNHPGRANAEQVTVFGGVGLAFQDAVAAWAIYQAALREGVGQEIDFIS